MAMKNQMKIKKIKSYEEHGDDKIMLKTPNHSQLILQKHNKKFNFPESKLRII